MNEQQFHIEIDKVFLSIEMALERSGSDIDYEFSEGILTLLTPEGDELVFSRQTALRELWLASKQGAFHFQLTSQGWETKQGKTLQQILLKIGNISNIEDI